MAGYKDNFKTVLMPLVTDLASAEKMNFSNLLFNAVFLASDITKKHVVVTGVRNGNVVPIITKDPSYTKFPFVDASTCDINECEVEADFSAYKWNLALISCRIPICLRTFDDNFLIFWNSYRMLNPGKVDTTYKKSAIMAYIVDLVKNEFEAAKWRGAYYAMEGHPSDLLDGFDGYFEQAGAVPANKIVITKNDTDTNLTGQEIYDLLVEMEETYDEADWAEQTNGMEFRMTKKMARTLASYMNKLKDTSCCDGIERLDPDNIGSKTYYYDRLTFHGYPIVPMPEWDAIQKKVTALKVAPTDPIRINRVLFIEKTNMLIGTEERDQLSMIDIFYDRTQRKIFIDAEAYYGVAIPLRRFVYAV